MQLAEHETLLVHGPGQAANATTPPADALAMAWPEIGAVLSPLVGERGAAALYVRAVQLLQSSTEAGSISLLQTVRELLVPLIGPGLTVRLLHPLEAIAFAREGARRSGTIKTGEPLP